MAEPIAVEESLDEGSLPEPRNFICGVVEGLKEMMDEISISPPSRELNSNQDQPSSIPLLHLSDNPWRRLATKETEDIETNVMQARSTNHDHSNDKIEEARKLLNKLSDANFEIIASKFYCEKFDSDILKQRNWDSSLCHKMLQSDTNPDEIQPSTNCEIPHELEQMEVENENVTTHSKKGKKSKRQKAPKEPKSSKKERKKPKIPVQVVDDEELGLNTCANPWKGKKSRTVIKEEVITEDERVLSEAMLLLNKLDLDNFHSTSKQFCSLSFNEDVDTIFGMLFKKAVSEGMYAEQYAGMIRNLYDIVTVTHALEDIKVNETNTSKIGKHIVNDPEMKNIILGTIENGIQNAVEHVTNDLIVKTKDNGIPSDDIQMEYRNKLVNGMKFIAALFNCDLVKAKQVLAICFRLLEETTEINIESLVVLLTQCGKKMENDKNRLGLGLEWKQVLTSVERVFSNDSISKRSFFKLLDVFDLYHRNWTPRVIHIPEPQLTHLNLISREKQRFKAVRNKKDISLYYKKELQYMHVVKQPLRRGCFRCKELDLESIFVKTRFILNRINETNFDYLSEKFAKSGINSINLDSCVGIIFNKCIQDLKYSKIYLKLLKAYVTYKMENKEIETKPTDLDEFDLVNLFVNKSIQMFNASKTFLETQQSEVLTNNCFVISELFHLKLAELSVLFDLLLNLINVLEEWRLICVTKIITLCGVEIEIRAHEKEELEAKWNEILEAIEDICASKRSELTNRAYLMLSNVLKLKDRNWVSRTEDPLRVTTKGRSRVPRHVRVDQALRREKEEKMAQYKAERANLFKKKQEFMIKNILKDLNIADNPWRRGEFKRELTETERTIMEAKTMLNKLAENNFNSIVEQFAKLKFSEDTVEPILNALFVKSILETKFTELYAKFVKSVSDVVANGEENLEESGLLDLKTLIVDKCVTEIDNINSEISIISNEIYEQKRRENIDDVDMTGDDESGVRDFLSNISNNVKRRSTRSATKWKMDFIQSDYRVILKKKISVGTCHFLGELFNEDVVDVNFILTTIVCDLLAYETEESVECAVKLISVVGKKLERIIERSDNDDYKAGWNIIMEDIAAKASPVNRDRWSNRIYFMLLDLIDLKQRDWLPRVVIVPMRQFKIPKKARGF
ncbi:hypothetical protein M8J76_001463 [Diaphorina citri]|nr:hypothetical protein M8J75_014524 [Diaphorina citri]KAI5713570.1 hypothetical protein M8J76_001463 [Diaphorina citri]KAI5714816.1 hypothetical protein M8J77_005926 [Diaphorina citri]